ncbi:MAG: LysE family transporter [Lachnospiraceae bacterium]|nr:LysE family transporter [Lachnospiraceae bacterium]
MGSYFFRGILIGLLFGLPVGAVGTLTVQRTIHNGAKAGLFTGLGSSVADCFYAAVGVFGLTLVSDFLLKYQTVIHLFGGILILFMGIRIFCKEKEAVRQEKNDVYPEKDVVRQKKEAVSFVKMFLTSFAIGITNPAAILTFLFAFSYFGISGQAEWLQGILLVCGVFIGTYLWWGTLTLLVTGIKKKAAHFSFKKLNRVFGCILCFFGIVVLARIM